MFRWFCGLLALLLLASAGAAGWVYERSLLKHRILYHRPGAIEPGQDDHQLIAETGVLTWKTTARLGEKPPAWYPHADLPGPPMRIPGFPSYSLQRTLFSLDASKPPPAYLSRYYSVPLDLMALGLLVAGGLMALTAPRIPRRIRKARHACRAM